MVLSPDFKEFLKLLNKQEVEYLVVGGYAVVIHGYPRLTGDIDLWIKPTIENSRKVVKVLEQFGFDGLHIRESDFVESENIM
jgi:hypothetical protein